MFYALRAWEAGYLVCLIWQSFKLKQDPDTRSVVLAYLILSQVTRPSSSHRHPIPIVVSRASPT